MSENQQREIVPENTYLARARSGTFGQSLQKKTPFVRLSFCIDEGDFKGRMVPFDGYLTEETKKRTAEAMMNAGCTFPDNDFTDLTGLGEKLCMVVVKHEEFEVKEGEHAGEMRTVARVAFVNALGGMREDMLMTDVQKKSFAASMKGLLVNLRGGKPAPSPNKPAAQRQAPAEEGYDAGNEDIPF